MEEEIVDVVVVGAGPAGIAAALTLAKAGKEVVVIERGDFAGSKNVFGGAIYAKPTAEIYPEFWKTAPLERHNTEHRFAFLTDDSAVTISYKDQAHSHEGHENSFTVIRAKWDRWCAEQAEAAGAYIVPQTLVKSLLIEDGRVVGVKTEQEEFRARITILADGTNSLLATTAGFKKEWRPNEVALGVKEVIKLPESVINDRFNTENGSGVIYTLIGGPLANMMGLSFIYTNKDSIVLGLGVDLEVLKQVRKKPYELMEALKQHPLIRPLIAGGELIEYSGHLIPEGGYNSIPQLYGDGWMIVGNAAQLVNNVHWEGTNLAMFSGKYAAETAIDALEAQDYSTHVLAGYKKRLEQSFILKDLKSYKDVASFAEHNADAFMGFYPKKLNDFMRTFVTVDGTPKSQVFKNLLKNTLKERSIPSFMSDAVKLAKIGAGVLK